MLLPNNLTDTVYLPSRVENQSSMAIDNIFLDNYKFSHVYNGLSGHDAQLLMTKDINIHSMFRILS
jgi:hypothetical protein